MGGNVTDPQTSHTKSGQLREYLLHRIDGELRPHDRLPTERDLAEDFSVSRLTVRRVLDRMESEHRVYRIQGAGTFVSEPPIAKSLELASFSDDMRQRGLVPGSRVIGANEMHAGARIGYALNLSPADTVFHIARVRTADGTPMCVEDAYLPARLVPGLLGLPLEGSLYDLLSAQFRISLERADQVIRCTVLDTSDAETLEVPPLSPAFAVERTGYDARGRAIEHTEALYRGDRYTYNVTLDRAYGQTSR
jgi:GntR family transcriptional regulator, N-acetylglucosamine utilization regulator